MRALFVGYGTVAQGLSELLLAKRQELRSLHGLDVEVVGISDLLKGSLLAQDGIDLARALEAAGRGGLEGLPNRFDGDALAMIEAAEADVMVEATYTDIKTAEPATSHIRAALDKGMHVITTNKGPVALFLSDLTRLAEERNVKLYYEGTVMSGTPLLNLIRETLAGSRITEIKGILNGTTNYILSEMERGQPYDAVLEKAQELGYAEAVPDADVLGWDALAKITILANAVFGLEVSPDAFPCAGITEITGQAVADALARGKRYKLIGKLAGDGDGIEGSVGPEEIDLSHPLAGVMGATNAVTLSTDTLGEVTIVGPGAGRVPTGYSVLIDLLAIGGRR